MTAPSPTSDAVSTATSVALVSLQHCCKHTMLIYHQWLQPMVNVSTSKRIVTFSASRYLYNVKATRILHHIVVALESIVLFEPANLPKSSLSYLNEFQRVHIFLLETLDQDLKALSVWLYGIKRSLKN
ncbi:hypothetical protein PHYBLDRAFT_169460 [Phycomyces blakesleeanus NRRL 1555(-)]|uniref:Uncharacterized protein n=1 Tax=Phycomyces blakesleeanus (strain ATCC 8743b / DSM 1359 / FGSC 10004 / NBRC 33097 / NRRL 1555) TaxID=763407 RepID=A0A162TZR6_PHYB8|nr:hypothetical protein PHYBLDRAFT_169460 [Phycomyces blakesleeanus NRRL 1555(-)]OAD72322.1 hypothetical protein PHYBLDRAFT_169460 [Phycomyces blakesleeanus NRRL 1555(-)]|eukprot:XP_018290362.1 hypothetical protein PHYBLDRAFT_169460 [Phycomyces blakesleeanus NRRL 1555(-)]